MRTRFLACLAALSLVVVASACSSSDESMVAPIRLASIASSTGNASTARP